MILHRFIHCFHAYQIMLMFQTTGSAAGFWSVLIVPVHRGCSRLAHSEEDTRWTLSLYSWPAPSPQVSNLVKQAFTSSFLLVRNDMIDQSILFHKPNKKLKRNDKPNKKLKRNDELRMRSWLGLYIHPIDQ